ncbi:hypothetical protein Aduo_011348 [Ancylostoma duodenale]
MQWYFIIPTIFVVQRLATSWEKKFFAAIAGCSIAFYLRVDYTTAFYCLFARLWQFLCGLTAFLAQDKLTPYPRSPEYGKSLQDEVEQQRLLLTSQDETDEGEVDYGKWFHVLAIFLYICAPAPSLIWFALPSHILRFTITALTAALVYIGSLQKVPILGGDALAYVGDISYSLRLFHWPVYVIVKPHSLEQPLGTFDAVEPVPLKAPEFSNPNSNVNTRMLLLACRQVIRSETIKNRVLHGRKKEANQAVNMETPYCNSSERFDEKDVPRGAFCEAQNGYGAYNILVIGNSYAFNQGGQIYNAFKNHSREFNFLSFPGCDILTATSPEYCHVQNYNYSFILNALKPDILFVITRVLDGRVRFDPMKPIDEDKTFNDYMNRMNQFEEVVKKVYLLQALSTCIVGCARKAMEFTTDKRPLSDIKDGLIKREEVFPRARIWEVGKRCKSCEIIDCLPYVVDDDGQYLGYNPKTNIMYYDSSNHFNRFGKERIQGLYTNLANELHSKGI